MRHSDILPAMVPNRVSKVKGVAVVAGTERLLCAGHIDQLYLLTEKLTLEMGFGPLPSDSNMFVSKCPPHPCPGSDWPPDSDREKEKQSKEKNMSLRTSNGQTVFIAGNYYFSHNIETY